MTKTKARKVLGISSSVGLKSAEQIYRKKCQKAQLRMRPGNTIQDRQKAEDTLLQLASAWNALITKPVKRTVKQQESIDQTAVSNLPRNLADAWDNLFSALPLPQPVVVLLLITTLVMFVISLFR